MSAHVVVVASDGGAELVIEAVFLNARRAALRALVGGREADRIAAVRSAGRVPEACGAGIAEAPARGPVQVVEQVQIVRDVTDRTGYATRRSTKGAALRRLDALDLMEAKARKALFTASQKAAARDYAMLTEKLASAGVQCSSVEALRQGGGGGSYIDALLRDRERLAAIHRRIGSGAALVVRRIRPSQRNKRDIITDRVLVDAVCIKGQTLSEVLRSCGWVAPSGKPNSLHIKSLRVALCNALDRMAGGCRGRVAAYRVAEPGLELDQWYRAAKRG